LKLGFETVNQRHFFLRNQTQCFIRSWIAAYLVPEVFSRLVLDFLVISLRKHFFSWLCVTDRLSSFLYDICS